MSGPLLRPLRIESGAQLASWLSRAAHGSTAELRGDNLGLMLRTARAAEAVGDVEIARFLEGGIARFYLTRVRMSPSVAVAT